MSGVLGFGGSFNGRDIATVMNSSVAAAGCASGKINMRNGASGCCMSTGKGLTSGSRTTNFLSPDFDAVSSNTNNAFSNSKAGCGCGHTSFFKHMGCSFTNGCLLRTAVHCSNSSGFNSRGH